MTPEERKAALEAAGAQRQEREGKSAIWALKPLFMLEEDLMAMEPEVFGGWCVAVGLQRDAMAKRAAEASDLAAKASRVEVSRVLENLKRLQDVVSGTLREGLLTPIHKHGVSKALDHLNEVDGMLEEMLKQD